MLGNQITAGGNVYHVRIIGKDGEVDHGSGFGLGVVFDKVPQGSGGLGAEMAALDNVVVDDLADFSGGDFSGGVIYEINHGAEYNDVGHLSADGPGLYLAATEKAAHLLDEHRLYLTDKIRALVVENIDILEGLYGLVLGVSKGCIHH